MFRSLCFGSAVLLLVTSVFVPASAQITLTSATHNFNNVVVGQTVVYGVELTNTSATAFPFTLSLIGSSTFTEQNSCGTSVTAGSHCEIVFTFAPRATGIATANWFLAANGETFTPSDGGALSGNGVASPGFTITATGEDFGTWPINVASAPYGVVLENSTANPITLTINTTPAHYKSFPIASNNCPAQLPPNGECSLSWKFEPTAVGGVVSRFAISGVDAVTGTAVDLSSPTTRRVTEITLKGAGISESGVVLTSAGYYFGDQGVNTTSIAYGTVLTNATASTISLAYGGTSTTFPSHGNDCAATLAAYTSCNMQWQFAPSTAAPLSFNYAISAMSGGLPVPILMGGQPVTAIALSGTGITGTLKLSADNENFGPWVVNTQSGSFATTLTNSTPLLLALTYAYQANSDNADFNQTQDTCAATLAAGASCNLQWMFAPTTTGTLSTQYGINAKVANTGTPVALTEGGSTVQGVSLSGTSLATGGVSLNTASNNFGEQGVGGVSDTYSTTLYNTLNETVAVAFAYGNATNAKSFPLLENNCGSQMLANTSCTLEFEFTPLAAGATGVVYGIIASHNGTSIPVTSGANTVTGVTLAGAGVE